MAQAIKKIKVGDETHPIDGAFYLGTLSTVAGSASSGSYKSVRWYVSDCEGVTAPYDGMRIAIKIPLAGVGTAGAILSINGNTDADYHPLAYNVNTVLTTHFPVNSIKVFVYDASQKMNCYKTANTAVSVTGVWKADSNYDSNTTITYGTLEYYFRPYVATEALYRYKFVMLDKDNRLVPLTTTNVANGTAVTNQTPTAKAFRPDKIWWYATTTTISAGAVVGGQILYRSGYNANNTTNGGMAICNFNSTISAYRLIYLCGTFDKATGLFSLRGGGTASSTQYYTQVPTNTANLTLSSYFTSGYDYILLGGTYSSNNYIQLFDNNTMFHFDGTNLVPYDTWNTAQASSNQKVQGNGTGFGADATVNIVGGGNVTVTGDGTNNKITVSYTTPASLPANGGNAASLGGQGAAYYASAGALVNADWNATSGLSSILNKPTIPTFNSLNYISSISSSNTSTYKWHRLMHLNTMSSWADCESTFYYTARYQDGPHCIFRVEFRTNHTSAPSAPSIRILSGNMPASDMVITMNYTRRSSDNVYEAYCDVFVKVPSWARAQLYRIGDTTSGNIVFYDSSEATDAASHVEAYTEINGSTAGCASYDLYQKSAYDNTGSTISQSYPASDVSSWAKASTKPTYTANEVGALASNGTAVNSSKLNNQEASYYLNYNNLTNKPTIPTNTNQTVKAGTVTFGANDVVNFVGGGNVTVTGNATNKSITISYTTPGSLKNPNALDIYGNTTSVLSYDGSAKKSLYFKSSTSLGYFTVGDGTTSQAVYVGYSNTDTHYTSTFTVYGGSTSVATFNQSTNMTLSFAAGNNITLTPDATNHKITISATAPAATGWAGTLSLEANPYSNGTQSVNALYANNVYVSDAIWLSPNDIIYSDTADYDGIHITQFSAESRYLSVDYPFINLNGSTTINGSTYIYGDMVTYNVRPGTNAGYDLGSSNYRYNRLYASYVGTNLYPIDSIFASHLSVAGNGQTYISNSYISLYASSYNNTTYYSAILLSANAAGGRISLYAGGSIYQTACYGISLSASGTYSIYLRTLSSTSGEIFIGGSWSSSAAYFSSRIGSFSTSKTHIFGRNEVTITASVGSISLLPGNGHNIHPIQTIGYQCLIGNSTMVMSKTFSTTGGNIRNQTFTNNATSNTYFTMTFRRNTLSTGYFDVAINTTWAGGIDVWYRYNVGQMLAYFNNMIAGNDYTGSTSFIKIPTTANDWQSSYMTITATPKRQTAYGTGTTMCTLIGDAPANNSTAMYFYICEDNNNGGDRNGMCARFTMPVYLTNSRY